MNAVAAENSRDNSRGATDRTCARSRPGQTISTDPGVPRDDRRGGSADGVIAEMRRSRSRICGRGRDRHGISAGRGRIGRRDGRGGRRRSDGRAGCQRVAVDGAVGPDKCANGIAMQFEGSLTVVEIFRLQGRRGCNARLRLPEQVRAYAVSAVGALIVLDTPEVPGAFDAQTFLISGDEQVDRGIRRDRLLTRVSRRGVMRCAG